MRRFLLLVFTIALVVTACGDTNDPSATTTSTTMAMSNMDDADMDDADMGDGDMGDMNMGDPTATRADEVEGAQVESADFALLATRPPGHDDVAGTAWLARHDMGTTVTLELVGLPTGVDYIAHVHEGSCEEAGGDHYMFDPNGSEMPPNEIHLAFTSDAAGNGFMTAENHGVVGDNAQSVVVHPADLLDNKLACAEF
ncbi:MAG: superoxide dismutase family protein [Acidimicrobiia bacterium]|nr:superoxide dismutase family protein [Acidimicrobiia bacterium]